MDSPASTTRLLSPRPPAEEAPAWPYGVGFAYLVMLTAAAWVVRESTWTSAAEFDLIARGDLIQWGSSDLSWLAATFPPLSAAVSALLGGTPFLLDLAGGLVAAIALTHITVVLVRRGFGPWATAAVMATFLATPPVYYLATQNLQALMGLALVLVALDGLAGFVEHHSTEAGFRAGLALGLAVLVEPGGWVYALLVALLTPVFARQAGRADPGVRRASILVLTFPAMAMIAFWLYLSWWFSSDPWGGLRDAPLNGWFPYGGVGESARVAAESVGRGLISVPLFLVALGFRIVRNPWSLVAPLIVVVGLWASLWTGLREPAGQTYVALTGIYALQVAALGPDKARRGVIVAVALLQLAIVWFVTLRGNTPISDWMQAVWGIG